MSPPQKLSSLRSSIIQQKLVADLQSDRSRLEELASLRAELKDIALQSNLIEGRWVATLGGSFVFMNQSQANDLIAQKVKLIENEIVQVCGSVKAKEEMAVLTQE